MLIVFYSLCGLALGFIMGYWYGWDTHALMLHGKTLDKWSWFKRRIIRGEL